MFAPPTTKKAKPGTEEKSRAEPSNSAKQSSAANPMWQSVALRAIELQPKLAISAPSDPLEQEADRVADRVMRMAEPQPQNVSLSTNSLASHKLQRSCSACEDEEGNAIQRKAQTHSARSPADPLQNVHQALNSPGKALDPMTLSSMENHFGRDFSDVRVHYSAAAEQSARDVNAQAYTVGHDIVFGAGRFAPATREGQRLLAHELTHVVQQNGGPCSPPSQYGGMSDQTGAPASATLGGPISRGDDTGVLARQPVTGSLFETFSQPRSLSGSLAKDESNLDDAALMQEISLIQEWLRVNPAAPDAEHLRSELEALQTESLRRKEPKEGSVGKLAGIVHRGVLEAKEVTEAHRIYEATGKIPQTKTPFSWVEIKQGKLMTRAQRYDAMLIKRLKPATIEDLMNDDRDPEYLSAEEFREEFWTRLGSHDEVGEEISMRSEIIKGMSTVEARNCCTYDREGKGGHLNDTYWEKGDNYSFKAKPTGNPSAAIEAIFKAGARTKLECQTMIVAIEYHAMLKAMGKDAFNKRFPYGAGLFISPVGQEKPGGGQHPFVDSDPGLFDLVKITGVRDLLPGDWVYFKNIEDYGKWHPRGLWAGEAAVYLGNGKFSGFGAYGLSEAEMITKLLDNYNRQESQPELKHPEKTRADVPGLRLSARRPKIREIMNR